jgi:hypothetical protein
MKSLDSEAFDEEKHDHESLLERVDLLSLNSIVSDFETI